MKDYGWTDQLIFLIKDPADLYQKSLMKNLPTHKLIKNKLSLDNIKNKTFGYD